MGLHGRQHGHQLRLVPAVRGHADFLFSGTFFSVSLLPAPLEILAWFTPLFHGVSLCRGIALGGTPLWRQVVHTTFLVRADHRRDDGGPADPRPADVRVRALA